MRCLLMSDFGKRKAHCLKLPCHPDPSAEPTGGFALKRRRHYVAIWVKSPPTPLLQKGEVFALQISTNQVDL